MRSRLRIAVFTSYLLSTPASAWTEKGFMTSGGVGGISCPDFLNFMASSRQAGGFDTRPGLHIVNPFIQYANGFGTAYNMTMPDMYDLYDSLRPNVGLKVLFLVEPWCRENPGENFDRGLIEVIKTLLPSAKREQ